MNPSMSISATRKDHFVRTDQIAHRTIRATIITRASAGPLRSKDAFSAHGQQPDAAYIIEHNISIKHMPVRNMPSRRALHEHVHLRRRAN